MGVCNTELLKIRGAKEEMSANVVGPEAPPAVYNVHWFGWASQPHVLQPSNSEVHLKLHCNLQYFNFCIIINFVYVRQVHERKPERLERYGPC
jgi:hypothetical protein